MRIEHPDIVIKEAMNVVRNLVGNPITYERTGRTLTVQAAPSHSTMSLDRGPHGAIEWSRSDFIVASDDLQLDGETFKPRCGDRIHHSMHEHVVTYEVLGFNRDTPAWQYCDPYGTTIRIHCKEIGRDLEV